MAIEPISTNRPNLSQGADVVPQGTVQIELGVSYFKDTPEGQTLKAHTYPEVLVRAGLLNWLELQVSGSVQDSVVREPLGRRKVQGIGPVAVGLVAHLLDEEGIIPSLALKGAATLPVGNSGLRPDHAVPELLLAASKSITKEAGLLLNAGYTWEEGKPISHLVLNLDINLSDAFSVYLEGASDKEKGERAAFIADAGILWRLMPNLQLDLAAGRQLNNLATDYFITTGISVRLPR